MATTRRNLNKGMPSFPISELRASSFWIDMGLGEPSPVIESREYRMPPRFDNENPNFKKEKEMNETENLKKCIDDGHKFEVSKIANRYYVFRTMRCSCCGYTKETKSGSMLLSIACRILGIKGELKG